MANHYLITGGAGFIGSNLARGLLEQGHKVTVLDNLSTGNRANLADIAADIVVIEADVRDTDKMHKACSGIDVILHHAALASVPLSIDDPLATEQINSVGTLNILLAARDQGVKRVVFAGSSSIYGNTRSPASHEKLPSAPLSPYGLSKLTGEGYCQMFHRLYGLETVVLRYFNVFGPRQNPRSQYAAVIPIFITSLLSGQAPTIYGDGEQTRDFTYVANVVHANLLAATSPNAAGHVMNLACGQSVSLNQILSLINQELGTSIAPVHQPRRVGDIKHSRADITKAQKLLGYEPVVAFDQGLRHTIQWYREREGC